MKVSRGTVVSVDYSLHFGDGQVVDKSGDTPLSYLHGYGQIVPGLERALEGMEVGEHKIVEVTPGDGYGEHDPEAIQQVPRDAFPPQPEPTAGMKFVAQDPEGNEIPMSIREVREGKITVDLNHPLAGKHLHFDVTIRDVRSATAEEVEHGHAHEGDSAH